MLAPANLGSLSPLPNQQGAHYKVSEGCPWVMGDSKIGLNNDLAVIATDSSLDSTAGVSPIRQWPLKLEASFCLPVFDESDLQGQFLM